jgi:hypothetical protein
MVPYPKGISQNLPVSNYFMMVHKEFWISIDFLICHALANPTILIFTEGFIFRNAVLHYEVSEHKLPIYQMK